MRKGNTTHSPSGWSRRAKEGRISFRRERFVVEARRTSLERPGLSVGVGWEIRYRRLGEAAREHVVRRVTTRAAAVDALTDLMDRLDARGTDAAERSDRDRDDRTGDEKRPVIH